MLKPNPDVQAIQEICGSNPYKCMQCGKCTATCLAAADMDIKPHQFASYIINGRLEELANCESLYKCLSCFACVERCPRGVEPGRLVDAARMYTLTKRGNEHIQPEQIPELIDDDTPQQLLVSVFRKYRR